VANEVVAHYMGGRLVKGTSLNVGPDRPTCHIRTAEQGTIEVKLAELKALFFVRDLVGDAKRKDGMTVDPNDARVRGAHPIDLQFTDGERVVGLTVRYPPMSPFFFVMPADAGSNNIRILVNRAALARLDRAAPAAC
jgi:hypothetical protein